MKKPIIIFTTLIVNSLMAQTGIGTVSPHPSAVLDIVSNDKGILLPQVILNGLNDNKIPIDNPAESTLVYNMGGNLAKGYYYWNGTNWERLLINDEKDQILALTRNGGASSQPILIPNGTSTNIITLDATPKVNTIPGASFTAGQNITLPAGIYKATISLTGNSINTDAATTQEFIGSNRLFALSAGIVDSNNTLITPLKTSSAIAGDGGGYWIYGFHFIFTFELTSSKTIKIMVNHANGSSDSSDTRAQHAGLLATFYRFYKF